jgi:hypothetical protein
MKHKVEIGEDVTCIGKCWTCKEDDEMRMEWGTEETMPTSNEHESTMEEESEEGYEMFEETSSESEDEEKEAVYEVNNNDCFYLYRKTSKKVKNECLITMKDKMHSYLREVVYERPNVHDDKNWVEVVKTKLISMQILDIKTTLTNIRKFNPTLMRDGRAMFFKITLRRMIKVDLEIIVDEDCYGDLNELIDKVASNREQNPMEREKRRMINFSRVRFCAIGINTI